MLHLFAAAVLAIVPIEDVRTDEVDSIEFNSYGCCDSRQVIFRDFYDLPTGSHVVAWRWGRVVDESLLSYDYARRRWCLLFADDDGTLRRVFCSGYYSTWTKHDPEAEDRQVIPDRLRRGLRR